MTTADIIHARLIRKAATGSPARLTMAAAIAAVRSNGLTCTAEADIRAAVAADAGLALSGRNSIGLRA